MYYPKTYAVDRRSIVLVARGLSVRRACAVGVNGSMRLMFALLHAVPLLLPAPHLGDLALLCRNNFLR